MKSSSQEHWYENTVLYQIYPLSFCDANSDGIGDLQGIIKHLDYLNDGTPNSLGVGAIWLSPVYRSPMLDGGYDVADYRKIDPVFGKLADLDVLIFEAHKRGIKVLLDLVVNHTSDRHPWFRNARLSRIASRRDWYIWADPKADGGPPNNWLSRFGKSAWEFDEHTGQYYLHSFGVNQPDLNWRNPAVRNEVLNIMRYWLDRGIDGFRADAASSYYKDSGLRDDVANPNFSAATDLPDARQLRIHSEQLDKDVDVITSFCELMDNSENKFLVSEAYLDIPELQQYYRACDRHPIHAPFNLNLVALPWSAAAFRDFIEQYESSLRPDDLPNYILGNHDRSRVASRYGRDKARLLALMQLTLRGLPIIYNGEELGLEDAPDGDIDLRHLVGIDSDDKRAVSRNVMPWVENVEKNTTKSAKLSLSDHRYGDFSVESQTSDPESMLSLYRALIHLRGNIGCLRQGAYEAISTDCAEIFAYKRSDGLQTCYVFLNFSANPCSIQVEDIGRWIAGTHLVDGDGVIFEGETLRLDGYEGRMYELSKGKTI